MTTDDLTWMADWTLGVRVWLERDGQAVLGAGRLELLEGIDRCHSISAAARQAGISYRHAWIMVQEVNRGAGEPLVEVATGGRHDSLDLPFLPFLWRVFLTASYRQLQY